MLSDPLNALHTFLAIFDQTGPADVATHDAHESVTDFFRVHDDLCVFRKKVADFAVKTREPLIEIVHVHKRAMAVDEVEFLICMQVVRCGVDGEEAAETTLADPDDFLLPPHASVGIAITTGTLADSEFVLDNPGEVTRGDTEGPFAAQFRGHQIPLSEWTEIIRMPRYSMIRRRALGTGDF